MELLQIANAIQNKINELDKYENLLLTLATNKAKKMAEYEKELATMLIKIRNGVSVEIDGNSIIDPPATIIEKIAKGVCVVKKIEADVAEALYKNAIIQIDIIEAQLNGYQSLNRHLSEN